MIKTVNSHRWVWIAYLSYSEQAEGTMSSCPCYVFVPASLFTISVYLMRTLQGPWVQTGVFQVYSKEFEIQFVINIVKATSYCYTLSRDPIQLRISVKCIYRSMGLRYIYGWYLWLKDLLRDSMPPVETSILRLSMACCPTWAKRPAYLFRVEIFNCCVLIGENPCACITCVIQFSVSLPVPDSSVTFLDWVPTSFQ